MENLRFRRFFFSLHIQKQKDPHKISFSEPAALFMKFPYMCSLCWSDSQALFKAQFAKLRGYFGPPYKAENKNCFFTNLFRIWLVGWFCCFTSQVNSYGHCGTVSSPSHTFSWAGLNKRFTSNLCTYFRL